MTKIKNYLPKDKEDLDFIFELEVIDIKNIPESQIFELFEWLQDFNWQQATLISSYFNKFSLGYFENIIIQILKSKDYIWIHNVLKQIVLKSNDKPSENILFFVNRICENPSEEEKEEDLHIICYEILKKNDSPTGSSVF